MFLQVIYVILYSRVTVFYKIREFILGTFMIKNNRFHLAFCYIKDTLKILLANAF